MGELLFDDIFIVENVDPDGKKYDKGMHTFFVSFHFNFCKDQTVL